MPCHRGLKSVLWCYSEPLAHGMLVDVTTVSLSPLMDAYSKQHKGRCRCGWMGKGFGRHSCYLALSPLESRAAHKYHPAFPRNSQSCLLNPRGIWGNWTIVGLARELPPSHLNSPPSAGRVLGWVCISVRQKEISSCAERQAWGSVWQSPGHQEGQLPRKWFSRWVWHWVPALTLTPLTIFSPVYSTFSRDGFVDCFSGCCFDSR